VPETERVDNPSKVYNVSAAARANCLIGRRKRSLGPATRDTVKANCSIGREKNPTYVTYLSSLLVARKNFPDTASDSNGWMDKTLR
jgi:hypothetical protein